MGEETTIRAPGIFPKTDLDPVDRLRALLSEIISRTKERLKADRVSIFLYDKERCELWSVISQERKIMRFDARLGIAGNVARTGRTINVADAYEQPLFHKEIDLETGYRTHTLLAVPLVNSRGETIGVGEAINKQEGLFSEHDAAALKALAASVAAAIESAGLEKQLHYYLSTHEINAGEANCGGFSTREIIGMSPRMESVIRLIDLIRENPIDVLIQGESGTGKDLIAKALHHSSPRSRRPFIAVNSAGLSDTLLQSELFGHEPGAFTGATKQHIGYFESAHGGTIFLDEIGDMSMDAQKSILRALQARTIRRLGGTRDIPIDIRVIAATNKDLPAAMKEGRFRSDLYYRLNVIPISTPPLREILDDIPRLAKHFLAKHCQLMNVPLKEFTASALDRLTHQSWPGNTRQLENEIKRLIATVRPKVITEEQLNLQTESAPKETQEAELSLHGQSLNVAVKAFERRILEEAIRKCNGNKQKAAQFLGISRQGLNKKLKRSGVKA
ncbi:MAG: sigma 54-interacting transcriptional regulator [Candidatus Binatia bacterium]